MTIKTKIQPWILIISIVYSLFYSSCTELDELNKSYSIELSFDDSKGAVECLPGVTDLKKYEQVFLTATSKEGYEFKHWKGLPADCDSSKKEVNFRIQGSLEITALFSSLNPEGKYSLNVSVDSSKGIVECSDKKEMYEKGDSIALKAIAKDGYTFQYWKGLPKGCDSTKAETGFRINSNLEITALFSAQSVTGRYSMEVVADDTKGSVEISNKKDNYKKGESITLTATPKDGYSFKHWNGLPKECDSTKSEVSFAIMEDLNITAQFVEVTKVAQYSLVVTVDNVKGEVEISNKKEMYEKGEAITLTAVPKDGYRFIGWTGDFVSGENTIDITMTQNYNITANFEIISLNKPDVSFRCTVEYDKEKDQWNINADLIDSKINKPISNAVITMNGNTLYEQNSTYTYTLNELAELTTLEIKVSHNSFEELNFSIQVPREFTEEFTYELNEYGLSLEWQDLGSDEYYIYRKFDYVNGNSATLRFPGPLTTETSFSVSMDKLWEGPSHLYHDEIDKVEIYVCPVNFKWYSSGDNNKSYIKVVGKPTPNSLIIEK
jgi:uncharacterized repeat protein (TIGR02543 family)